MSAETNKHVVLSFFENLSGGKVDAALALMGDSATWWVAGKPDKFALAGSKTKTQFGGAAQRDRCGDAQGAARDPEGPRQPRVTGWQ